MTNQSSDTQPALRARNTLVRGGRLTKFKGRVASIAPGLSVVATAAVLFTGGAAQADDECGNPTTNGVVSCNATNYNDGITYKNPNARTLTLSSPGFRVEGTGVTLDVTHDHDISVQVDDGGDVDGTITTDGAFNSAILRERGAMAMCSHT